MGLDFSHGEAHFTYSGFHSFRRRVGFTALGVDLRDDEGFDLDGPGWRFFAADPIVDLLNHVDCDGDLTVEQCRKIAPRLREVIAPWGNSMEAREGLRLADAMEKAVQANEPLEFK